ncbi:acyl carrier protein [Polymorphobacter megasporae]|uniref:acyl carrier protein n=1 Tax=Glacieibacterium megasporae TaxID=2835787 RepID=UPI0021054952|nr:acyl carrier protein [Polymorphobacter megasporae]
MTVEEIVAKIADVMVDVFDVDELDVTEATSADDVDEWDSLSHIRFIITLERLFKIKFLNEEIADLKNVGDLARVIQAKLPA